MVTLHRLVKGFRSGLNFVMKPNNDPVDARVRLEIAQWPDDAPRGAVTTFCLEHGISRKTFYKIRAIAQADGQAAALEPRSRRPKTSPTQLTESVKLEALKVRAALESSGLDHGPISVYDKMKSMGLEAPSTASLARIFREKNVARKEPQKRPRAAWRRFVYPAPNACWQLDATEYVLTGGRKCVIFQLQDDHSRLAVASLAASGETREAAVTVAKKGIAAHGVPQRLLTDNGLALNPIRRGWESQLYTYMSSLGVLMITGKPYKPTTQGKNERFHQTLFRFLDKQPIAATLDELQEHMDRFDALYNTQRPHQGLPGRVTPQQAWDATPVADPPRPWHVDGPLMPAVLRPPAATPLQIEPEVKLSGSYKPTSGQGHHRLKVYSNGTVRFNEVVYSLSTRMAFRTVGVYWDVEEIIFMDAEGQVIAEFAWPKKDINHVGMKSARKAFPPMTERTSPDPNPSDNPD